MAREAEELLQHRDRCLDMAERAPTQAIRASLLKLARLYEIEAGLATRARETIAESKELIIAVDALLNGGPKPAGS